MAAEEYRAVAAKQLRDPVKREQYDIQHKNQSGFRRKLAPGL
jgi:hypothetical protein